MEGDRACVGVNGGGNSFEVKDRGDRVEVKNGSGRVEVRDGRDSAGQGVYSSVPWTEARSLQCGSPRLERTCQSGASAR